MRNYTQLTQGQRYQIFALMKAGHSQTVIAKIVDVHKSTISREVRRNTGLRGYRPKQAQSFSLTRRQSKSKPRISSNQWQQVNILLKEDWSPEQISLWLQANKYPSIGHERIYQYVYRNQRIGGSLYRHPRCQKKRRKRYGSYSRRGQLMNRVSIDKRPQYFPEGSEFKYITDKQIERVMDKLNNRPRKYLGMKTPKEVFSRIKPPVALAI